MHSFFIFFVVLFAAESVLACNRKSEKKKESKRIAGSDVKIEDYPYNAQVINNDNGGFICAAVIIESRFVLTASQCVNRHRDFLRIKAGSATRESGESHTLDEVVTYPACTGRDAKHCISIIRVKPPFQPGFKAHKIYMASEEPEAGTKAIMTGWGQREGQESFSSKLQKVDVEVMSRQSCQKEWYKKSRYGDNKITEKLLCTLPSKTVSFGDGDRGGPLVVNNRYNNNKELVGVLASLGEDGEEPVTYLNIIHYRDWINKEMERMRKEVETGKGPGRGSYGHFG